MPATGFLRLGVEHILGGIDHLLFVLCLVLLVDGARRLLVTITAFTLAHSVTLALATLGVVRVPSRPVEAVDRALDRAPRGRAGAPLARRDGTDGAAAVAGRRSRFGLLHGLGFAGALSEVGLPAGDIPLALFLFNVGVELGQVAFVAAVLGRPAAAGSRRRAGSSPALGAAGARLRHRLRRRGLAPRARRGDALSRLYGYRWLPRGPDPG